MGDTRSVIKLADIGALRGDPEGVIAPALPAHDRSRRFRRVGGRHLVELDERFRDPLGLFKALGGIAGLHLPPGAVGLEMGHARVDLVRAALEFSGEDDRSVGREGLHRVKDGGQLLVLDFDKLKRLVGDILRIGGTDRDRVSREVYDLVHKQLMGRPAEHPALRQVLVGKDAVDAGHSHRPLDADALYARVGVGTSQYAREDHARHAEIVKESRLPGHDVARVGALPVLTDMAVRLLLAVLDRRLVIVVPRLEVGLRHLSSPASFTISY